MSDTETVVEEKADSKLAPHQQKVYDWRLEEFKRMGYIGPIAEALAGSNADLHTSRKLFSQGCSLALMLKILM